MSRMKGLTGATAIPVSGSGYEGHDLAIAGLGTIWSAGKTPRQAIAALCRARWGGKLQGALRPIGGKEDPKSPYTWGFRFTSNGTHFKAAGIHVPGGVLLTWWK